MLSRPSCLIIDDAEVVRKVARHVIQELGFTVEEAATTDDGLVRCRPTLPNLIVLDWQIPGSNPLEFIAAVRSLPGGKQVKILYVVTNNDSADISRAIAGGADDYMIKPFRRVTLETKAARLTSAAPARSDEPSAKPVFVPTRGLLRHSA